MINVPPGPITAPSSLTPRRSGSLVSRIASAIFRVDPGLGPQEDQRTSTQTSIVSQLATAITQKWLNVGDDRVSILADVEVMDRESEEFSRALDTIANNVVTSDDGTQTAFMAISKDARVQKVIDTTNKTCSLQEKVPSITRNLVKYGDDFSEIRVNGLLQIYDVVQIPPQGFVRNQDPQGNLRLGRPRFLPNGLPDPQSARSCAFEQYDDSGRLLASFFPWQIVHGRLNWDGFSEYGRALGRVSRRTWRKLRAVEESMIVGRITRDLLKLVFYIDTTGLAPRDRQTVVNQFKREVTQRNTLDTSRDTPLSVMTDFFISDGYVRVNGQALAMRSKVDTIDPKNEGLHRIEDVEYLHRKYVSTLMVPPAHMSYERDINAKATLTQQDVQYVRWLKALQGLVGKVLRQVYDTALVLEGINPTEVDYKIVWPKLKAIDQLTEAQADQFWSMADGVYLQANVIDAQWIWENRFNMTAEEIDELEQRIDEQVQEQQQLEQEKAAQAHQQALEVIDHQRVQGNSSGQRENATGATKALQNGNKAKSARGVAAETLLLADAIAGRVEGVLTPEIGRISRDQRVSLEEARRFTDLAVIAVEDAVQPLLADTTTADLNLPVGSGSISRRQMPVIENHLHFEKGMVDATSTHHSEHHHEHRIENHIEVPEPKVETHVHAELPAQEPPRVDNHIYPPPSPVPDVKVTNEIHPPAASAPGPTSDEGGEVEVEISQDEHGVTYAKTKRGKSSPVEVEISKDERGVTHAKATRTRRKK